MNYQRIKKAIDNTEEKVYNIGIGDKGPMDTSEVFFPNLDVASIKSSLMGGRTKNRILTDVKEVIQGVITATEKYKDICDVVPVASGGFFTSVFTNQIPNDLDIFINTHGMSEEEVEDYIALLEHSLPDYIASEESPSAANYRGRKEEKKDFKAFKVYDLHNVRYFGCKTQLIFKDCGPPREDRSEITDDFYCSLVKMYMPLKEPFQLRVSKEAMYSFENKRVIVYEDSSTKTLAKMGHLKVATWSLTRFRGGKICPPINKKPKKGRNFAEEAVKSTMSLAAVRQL